MGVLGDAEAILNSIVSNSYYGMLRERINMYLPPKHPIMAIWNNRIKYGRLIVGKCPLSDVSLCLPLQHVQAGYVRNLHRKMTLTTLSSPYKTQILFPGSRILDCIPLGCKTVLPYAFRKRPKRTVLQSTIPLTWGTICVPFCYSFGASHTNSLGCA